MGKVHLRRTAWGVACPLPLSFNNSLEDPCAAPPSANCVCFFFCFCQPSLSACCMPLGLLLVLRTAFSSVFFSKHMMPQSHIKSFLRNEFVKWSTDHVQCKQFDCGGDVIVWTTKHKLVTQCVIPKHLRLILPQDFVHTRHKVRSKHGQPM